MEIDKNARTWATLSHLSALITLVGVPLDNILGPLVVWLAKRQEYEFVDDQRKEALNFQITFTFVEIALFVLILLFWPFILPLLSPLHADYRYPHFAILLIVLLMMGLFVLNIGLVIMAAIRSNEGTPYRYPFTLRIIK